MDRLVATASNPAAQRLGVLHRLLEDSLALTPEYDIGMSNHLPIALAALDGLGADEARMRSFYAHYAGKLRRRASLRRQSLEDAPSQTMLSNPSIEGIEANQANDAAPTLPAGLRRDWKTLRGHFDDFESLQVHFAAALAERGVDAVLREALPALLDGAAGAAFHGPIRIAHAIESGHDGELAAALAYGCARWQPLPAPGEPVERFTDPLAWLDALDACLLRADPGWRSMAPLISERMQQAALTVAYRQLAGGLAAGEGGLPALLDALARAAAPGYAATANFTVLHMATATRAAQVLSVWVPPDAAAWPALLHAVAAASLSARAVVRPRPRDVADRPLDWSGVCRLARASDDDHVIKLVHAMMVQNARAPDAAWLAAARTAVRAELA